MGCVYMLQCSLRGRPVRCVHVAMFVEGEACEMCAWCNVRGQRGTWTSYSVQTTTGHTTLVTEFVAARSCHNIIFSSQPWPLKGKEHKVQDPPPPPPPPVPSPFLRGEDGNCVMSSASAAS